jgi:glucose/arabinose dehydrogenase
MSAPRDFTRALGRIVLAGSAIAVIACGAPANLSVKKGMGPTPVIPAPKTSLIPIINVVDAKGWKNGGTPTAAPGLGVKAFANGLNHPRWLYVLPNGDVLVAETNAPDRPDDGKGIKGFFFKLFQKKAGGAVPSANRITLLRDTNGDGIADVRSVLLSGLYSPFGMALVGNNLYVANSDGVVRFPYTTGTTQITGSGVLLSPLPGGKLNHHWTKSLIASRDGSKLYAGVGSNSNAAENGIDKEFERAAVWQIDVASGSHRVFASGLRNPVGLAWEPRTGALWVSVNERDELGSDLVPDYMTSLRDGGFYGFPYSYYGNHIDKRVKPQRPDLVAKAIVPDYALGPHTASLGLTYGASTSLGRSFSNGMFVGQHGSWNRKPKSGYKVIFVPFTNGRPSGDAVDVLTGFIQDNGDAMGRPVGVAIDKNGSLLVADDVGNTVWRVSGSGQLPR